MSALSRQSASYRQLNLWQLVSHHLRSSGDDERDLLDELGQHLRFRGHIDYGHASHEVARIDLSKPRVEVFLNDHVMAGLNGPLPAPYLELCHQRLRDGDDSMAVFLDIFNHRLNALRYCQQARIQGELTRKPPQRTLAGKLLNAVQGNSVDQIATGPQAPLEARNLLALAGLMHHRQHSHTVVQMMLRRLIGLPLKLSGFQGGWIPLDRDQHTKLGSKNSGLGESTVLGTHCWDQHKGLELQIDLPDLQRFQAFLPGGARHDWLSRLVRWLTHYRFDIHVRLRLPASVPYGLELSSQAGGDVRLAWSSWLLSSPEGDWRESHFVISAQGGSDDAAN